MRSKRKTEERSTIDLRSTNFVQAQRLARHLIVVDDPRIIYLSIPKCGCTFVKNVMWYLKFSSFHSNPVRVHDDDSQFLRASDLFFDPRKLREEEAAFTVVRNPIDRFLSLYLDKVIGRGKEMYVPLAQVLIDRHGLIESPVTLRDHQYNLSVLADWIQRNLDDALDLPSEAHWTPQTYRVKIMREFNLKLLTLDKLSSGLEILLSRYTPRISTILSQTEQNSSEKKLPKAELLSASIRRSINEVYSADRKLYRRTSAAWENILTATTDRAKVPRYRDILEA